MATEMGIQSHGKIVMYQDNTSTIWLTANEGNFVTLITNLSYLSERLISVLKYVLFFMQEVMGAIAMFGHQLIAFLFYEK
jgi:hypothetical protein